MQQTKINLLSTRVLEETLLNKAADKNVHVDAVSFIETKPLRSAELAERIQFLSHQPVTAVFTSINAVNAVTTQLHAVPSWKIFCIGGVTKEYIIRFFGETSIIAAAKNATSLAEKIAASAAQDIVFFCGDHRLNDLPETLEKHGKHVEDVIVYTTEQTPALIERDYDGILFFSPSAVHSFFSVNTIPTNVVLFSIGQTTTTAIQSYCTNKVMTSEWPGADSIIEMVSIYYNKRVL